MNDENKLIERLKSRDERAFEALVSEYEKKIYALALRYTGSAHDAMDISQEVFLRVFRFIGGFSGASSLSTWLYRIALNVCKDFSAKKGKINTIPLEAESDGESYELEIADERFSPEISLESMETRAAIAHAIERLPDKYREIIVLRDINDLSYEQIGDALGLEGGTVKSRISRARERLRAFLLEGGNISGASLSKTVKGGSENE